MCADDPRCSCDQWHRDPRRAGLGRGLARVPGFSAYEARCLETSAGWAGPGYATTHQVTFVRSGAYLMRINGRETFVDATSVVVYRPGDEVAVAHPIGCGDTFTAVELDAGLLERRPDWADALGASAHADLVTDDALDLAHRFLIAACRRGVDGFEAAERLNDLVDRVLTTRIAQRGPDRRRPQTRATHRRLAARAQALLVDGGYAVGLDDVAGLLGYSPHHVSRVFRAVTGETLTAYRNRLRVRAVLTDLQDGAACLRTLAAEYGFADQAHLVRVMRRYVGQSPARLRAALLAPAPWGLCQSARSSRGGVQGAIRQGGVSSGYRCCIRAERQRRRSSSGPAAGRPDTLT
ncbi:MAG TPA: AraC family transcriptional regulator [Pilimelia sp.]|nr:AraC family transcriptional regulator [Pilimelia sp.]